MADNYLERKMEEYRRGASSHKVTGGPTKGKLSFNFPPRRVLLSGLDDEMTSQLAKAYGETGCRVAIYPETSTNVSGARLISSTDNPASDLKNVLKAWGDIDIVVSSPQSKLLENSLQSILSNRKTLPYPNDYGLRLILINNTTPYITESFTNYKPSLIETTKPMTPNLTLKIISSVLFLSINEMTTTNIQL